MRVFISWSGDTSKAIAQQVARWLPHVIQEVKPYFSPVDLGKGTMWNAELAAELQQAQFGILVLTADNLEAPWILFEAGAISKGADTSRVCPILFGVNPSDVKFPLAQFNATKFSQDEMFQLLVSINGQLEEGALDLALLRDSFEKFWPELEEKVSSELGKQNDEAEPPRRDVNSFLEEILSLSRSIAVSGIRTADTYRYTFELVEAYEHIVEYTKDEWIRGFGLGHCLMWVGSAIYPLAELTGDDELCEKLIFQVVNVFLRASSPVRPSNLIVHLAFNTGISKDALLRFRSSVSQAIEQRITKATDPEKGNLQQILIDVQEATADSNIVLPDDS